MTTETKIQEALDELGINATDKQISLWIEYLYLLQKWNKVYNMTSIKKFDDMLDKHLFDSLSIAKYIKGNSTVDVGTGGGLPGVVLAILYPEHKFTLVDSVGKKIMFLKNAKRVLKLDNIEPVNIRIEELEGSFDNIISRAFSAADKFYDLCKHFLMDNNQMLAMKGPDLEESNLAKIPLDIETHQITVPFLEAKRSLIIMRKRMSDNDFIKHAYEKIQSNLSDKAKLLAVSKYQSVEKIKYIASLGQVDFGENYLQELEQKAIEMPDLNWHFIGSIQSKKIKSIVKYANTIQSVEKFEHIEKINKYASQLSKQISMFLQINIDDVNKSGFDSNQIDEVIECVEKSSSLESVNVIGLMCLPAKDSIPSQSFEKMQNFYTEVNSMLDDSQKLTVLSMGMSGDYLEAINYGSTMVRVGSNLFGERVK